MSRAEILTVCELAAHLAGAKIFRDLTPCDRKQGPALDSVAAGKFAADAMKLQRLGRNARVAYKTKRNDKLRSALMHIHDAADNVLRPYGLDTVHHRNGILIPGLPGNTWGGDEGGYGI